MQGSGLSGGRYSGLPVSVRTSVVDTPWGIFANPADARGLAQCSAYMDARTAYGHAVRAHSMFANTTPVRSLVMLGSLSRVAKNSAKCMVVARGGDTTL